MLQQFSWQQFLIAALILSLIWYGALLLLFYRKWLSESVTKRQRNRKPSVQSSIDPREEHLETDPDDEVPLDLMGKSALPEGVSEAETGTFAFAPGEEDVKQDLPANRERQLGLIPDIIEELKTLFRIIEKEHAGKEDFISLFQLISSKYPGIKDSSQERVLNEYIQENLPFELSQEELSKLWQ